MLATAVLLALLLPAGCALVEGLRPEAGSGPPAADCPASPPCPVCDPPQSSSKKIEGRGPFLEQGFKEEYLVELLNDYRQKHGLPRLRWSDKLYIATTLHAQAWTQACRTREGCSDQCWKNDQCPYELSFAERLKLAGYAGSAQELLAAGDGYYDSRDVLADWTDEGWYPSAYAALTSPDYREIACSFVRCHRCWVHTIYVCLLGIGEP